MMGTEIFHFGPGKAEKIGFKNLNYKVIVKMDFSKKGSEIHLFNITYITLLHIYPLKLKNNNMYIFPGICGLKGAHIIRT